MPKPKALVVQLSVLLISLVIATIFITSKKMTIMPLSTIQELGVIIHNNPPQSKLDQLGVTSWPTWSGQPSKFPWTFEATETMYLLEGKVKVSIDGHEGSFEIGGGDLVVFPKGMKITWDMIEAVTKHYSLEK